MLHKAHRLRIVNIVLVKISLYSNVGSVHAYMKNRLEDYRPMKTRLLYIFIVLSIKKDV